MLSNLSDAPNEIRELADLQPTSPQSGLSYSPIMTTPTAPNPQRIVLLGASNLTRSFPMVFEHLRSTPQKPLEVFAALGHGRSYGTWSTVFGRSLPGIKSCKLWDDLPESGTSAVTTRALLTDIGNDIVYGFPPDTIAEWVERCLQKLSELNAELIITLLPVESVERLPSWRFEVARRLLFPGKKLSLAQAIDQARRLNDAVRRLGEQWNATVIAPQTEWYGFDSIHIRRRVESSAWAAILSDWNDTEIPRPLTKPGMWRYFRYRSLRPAHRRLFGFEQQRTQPSLCIGQETSLRLY